ncbi:P-loop containing nucleoside triphosphate hydrolase protein [Elsinoe ampelina]|uniref:P-loop containing nucleoside triphosphate hydrolase protein n=1 Tax=Elsinoe ampelina TaxID=302913 RepID=A0A6A6G156_9PEZI|nr:P-loop containing nucleoside triphosphate hydrolase protein [Elsinoe ampelina]
MPLAMLVLASRSIRCCPIRSGSGSLQCRVNATYLATWKGSISQPRWVAKVPARWLITSEGRSPRPRWVANIPTGAFFRHASTKASLPVPSREQQAAIDTLLHTQNNLIIDAVAGSGKTTTILHLAQAAPETKFLVLVYNTRLMVETAERAEALQLNNLVVQNYHALGARFYTHECATDQGLKRIVQDDMQTLDRQSIPDFSVLVMDEQQDLNPILMRFVFKIMRDRATAGRDRSAMLSPRLVLLGDSRQELYSFNNADSRFLTLADRPELFGRVNHQPWVRITQTISNRLTRPNVDFINSHLLTGHSDVTVRAVKERDADGKPFAKPRYVICDPDRDTVGEVRRFLQIPGYTPEDVIVLAPSVRGRSAALYLANDLALSGIPVYRSDSDNSDIAPEVARGKVLICTYHQAKGIERKAAIVLGFDESYHSFYDKVAEVPIAASNPLYVAATRALEHLVLIHDQRFLPLPFVDLNALGDTCDVVGTLALQQAVETKGLTIPRFNVTTLIRNVSETLLTKCLQHLEVKSIAPPTFGLKPSIPTEVTDKYGLLESVSAITGTAVPQIYQWRRFKGIEFLKQLSKLLVPPSRQNSDRKPIRELPQHFYERVASVKDRKQNRLPVTTSDIIFLAAMSQASMDGDITKLLSLPFDGYDWMDERHVKDIKYLLDSLPPPASITSPVRFERIIPGSFPRIIRGPVNHSQRGIKMIGAMDISGVQRDEKTVWEIKHSQTLQPQHVLQVALYMLLLGENSSGFLVSTISGQVEQVIPKTTDSLEQILQLLVSSKTGGDETRLLKDYSDEEFLAGSENHFGNLVGPCALPGSFAARPISRRQLQTKVKKRAAASALDS